MALKKPSEYFKKEKPSVDNSVQELAKTPELNTFSDAFESFKKNLSKIEVLSEFSDTLDNYRVNIEKVNYLSEKVEDIQTEVQSLLKKEDLDRAMMSQLLVVEQSIRDVQSKVKGINEKNLTEIRLDVSGLTESVNEFLEVEVPKYKKLVVDSELRTNNRYEELEENVNKTLEGIGEYVDNKYLELTESLQGINEQSLAGIVEDFNSLDKIVFGLKEQEIPKYKGFIVETERKTESKLNEFNNILNQTVDNLLKKITLVEGDKSNLIKVVNGKIQEVLSLRDLVLDDLEQSESSRNDLIKKISDLEVEVIRNESHLKVQNKNLQQIQEDVRSAIQKLNIEQLEEKNYDLGKKVKYLEEVFEKFSEKEILTENIIIEPSSTDNKDPLTPLDQNFVTLDQLQQHYRLFINRIQQQLATIGGGGETRFEFLDDIDRDSVKQDGYVIQYNASVGKFIGTSYVSGGGSGGDSFWTETNAGIYTTGNVAIGTDVVSTGSTALWVQGDARITGILSVGTGTITLDPTENTIRVGTGITLDATNNIVSIGNAITLNSSTGVIEVQGSTIGSPNGDAFYTGIVTASSFVGDGSGLTGIVATGSGIEIKDNNTLVGTASTLNFGQDLDVTFNGGVATINVSIPLSALTDVNTSNLSGISTDYLMVYDPSVPGFKFVDPKTYFGINNDANPDPTIDDFGSY